MKVHNYFGMGFKEEIYERSLLIELAKAGIICTNQQETEIYYFDDWVGRCRLDILVEGKVLLELKAVSEPDKECINRLLNYLNVFKIEVGLFINFGKKSLEFKRYINSKKLK